MCFNIRLEINLNINIYIYKENFKSGDTTSYNRLCSLLRRNKTKTTIEELSLVNIYRDLSPVRNNSNFIEYKIKFWNRKNINFVIKNLKTTDDNINFFLLSNIFDLGESNIKILEKKKFDNCIVLSTKKENNKINGKLIQLDSKLPYIEHAKNIKNIVNHKKIRILNTDDQFSDKDFKELGIFIYEGLELSDNPENYLKDKNTKKKINNFFSKIENNDLLIFDFKDNKEFSFLLSNLPKKKNLIILTPIYGGEPMPILNNLYVDNLSMQKYYEKYNPKILVYPFGWDKFKDYNLSKIIPERLQYADSFALVIDILNKLTNQRISKINTEMIINEIKKFNGLGDIFIGIRHDYVFNNNLENIYYNFGLYTSKQTLINGRFYPILLENQANEKFTKEKYYFEKVGVNYLNIFMKKIFFIDTGNGVWSCNFELQIKTKHKDFFEYLIFNNLSKNNHFFEKIKLESRKTGDSYIERYDISANFSFNDKQELFPFDKQSIGIEISLKNKDKVGMISQLNHGKLNSNFELDSWKILDIFTGVKRTKTFNYADDEKDKEIIYDRHIILNFIVKRLSQISFFKIIIPIFFLLLVVVMSLFYDFKEDSSGIAILTTTFLSAIALYFSSEKPKADNLTNLDLLFTYFYVFNGIALILNFYEFINKIYLSEIKYLLFLLPISFVFHFFYRLRKYKNDIYEL